MAEKEKKAEIPELELKNAPSGDSAKTAPETTDTDKDQEESQNKQGKGGKDKPGPNTDVTVVKKSNKEKTAKVKALVPFKSTIAKETYAMSKDEESSVPVSVANLLAASRKVVVIAG